jgi:small redox-active disulfide protein 2
MKIEVLGPGCSRCKEAFRIVQQVVAEEGVDAEVVKEESMERMMALGLLATPGVAVDGKVVHSGRVPRRDDIRRFLGIA